MDAEGKPLSDTPSNTALNTGEIEIISRGFVYMDQSEELIEKAKEITRSVIANPQRRTETRSRDRPR